MRVRVPLGRATALLVASLLGLSGLGLGPRAGSPASAAPLLTPEAAAQVADEDGPATQDQEPPDRAMQFGLTSGCCTPTGVELSDQVDGYAATGAGWVRTGFSWRTTEPVPGVFSWGRDDVVRSFRSTGMQVLGVLASTPAWAADPACEPLYGNKCAPMDPAAFARFAAMAAERYDADGVMDAAGSPKVHAWEIWNEPNLAGFWRPRPDPAAYTTLLSAAYRAIKAVDPDAVVLSGGLAPAGGEFSPSAFLRTMYDNGAAGSFDALGFHPYSYPHMPTKVADWNAWQQMSRSFPLQPHPLRSVMTANGDGDKQIWATEYGAPTGGDTNGDGRSRCDADGIRSSGEDTCVTETRQAAMVTEAYAVWQTYSWAGPLFWYSYQDLATQTPSIENNFGLLRTDGTAKPAHTAYRAAALATMPDTTSPTRPSAVRAVATASSASLRWAASTDDRKIAGYHIFRDGSLVESTVARTFRDSHLRSSRRYTYTISAFDAAGNRSRRSIPLVVTTAAR